MKHIMKMALLVGIVACGTGCTTGYWMDRGRDAADIFTVSIGTGIGAKAQVGPVAPGLIFNRDLAGMAAGRPFTRWTPTWRAYGYDASFLLWGMYGHGSEKDPRLKSYRAEHWFLIAVPESIWDGFMGKAFDLKYPAPYFTQFEVVAGLGLSVRAGVNPGELLDFILGFAGVDIYNDDIGLKAKPEIEQTDDSPDGPNP